MSNQPIPISAIFEQKGKVYKPSSWVKIDQNLINEFADCTGDHQFIHTDPSKVSKTPLGGTVAHGFLTLSLLPKLCESGTLLVDNMVMGLNYGFNKIRFITPVSEGKRIRVHNRVADIIEKKSNHFLITQNISVEIEGEERPALIADWLIMIICQ